KSLEDKKVKALVVDMRDNGGGLVEIGLNIAEKLVGKGLIVYTEDGKGNKEEYKVNGVKTKLPYILLVNGNSASTTEIITAGIKDNKSAQIVGEKTFGKGVIQQTTPLEDGSAYKLTTLQYFAPDGQPINKKGIEPNIKVKNDAKTKEDEQLNKAIELLNNK
ncbi:MAG: S41 family peptidase, partial [Anaerovoracaceae bacterium]